MQTVLVTGASGFIASHVILALIEQGYRVRGTARSAGKAARINHLLSEYAGKPIQIEIVSLDLMKDEGWAEAMQGVDFLQHIASPFPATQPQSADELIIPAREGTLRALKAAKAAGVKRVVLTSSIAAMVSGWGKARPAVFDESHWTQLGQKEAVPFYNQSKTIAEQAAWAYIRGEGQGMELAVINPAAVLGPVMSQDVSTSLSLVSEIFKQSLPAFPKMDFGIVDVRDIAQAHLAAMEKPAAAGKRFIMSAGEMRFRQIGKILAEAYPEQKIPTRELPSWLVRLVALFMPKLRPSLSRLDKKLRLSHRQAEEVLGIDFISPKDAILASAVSLKQVGAI
ncbi:MAG: aldehyde reductase [Bacteroidota bacterium]